GRRRRVPCEGSTVVLPGGHVRAKTVGRARGERRRIGGASCTDGRRESLGMVVTRRGAPARARAWPSSGGRLGTRPRRTDGQGASRRRRGARQAPFRQSAED